MTEIVTSYRELRKACSRLEKLLQRITDADDRALTDKDLKRLDKAVTVMKVGFKIVKKVSGATKRDPAPQCDVCRTPLGVGWCSACSAEEDARDDASRPVTILGASGGMPE